MIRNELNYLFNNKLMVLVLFAIILIPSIYAGVFLTSMWDPYGNLEYLPAAVVNLDSPVEYNNKTLSLGDDMVDSLKDSDAMAFNFVDPETAASGLENGTYYVVITIPEDFSKNAASLMDDDPVPMELDYATNPGKNYIASKMSASAVKEIEKEITEKITRSYADALFDSIQELGDGFGDAEDAAGKLNDGGSELAGGNEKIVKGLDTLASSTLEFRSGSETFSKGLEEYVNGVDQLSDGAAALDSGVKTMKESAADGTGKLVSGSSEIKNGINKYTDGVSDLKNGSSRVLSGLRSMETALDQSLSEENVQKMEAAQKALPELNRSIQELDAALSGGSGSGEADTASLYAALGSAGDNISTAGDDIKSAGGSLESLSSDLGTMGGALSEMGNIVSSGQLDECSAAQLSSAISRCSQALGSAGSDAEGIRSGLSDAGSQLGTAGNTLNSLGGIPAGGGMSDLKNAIDQIAAASDQLLEPSAEAIGSLLDGMRSVRAGLSQTEASGSGSGLVEGMSRIDSGLSSLDNSGGSLKTGAASLSKGVSDLADGLDSGLASVSDGSGSLADGGRKLAENNDGLLSGAKKLSDGASKIASGSEDLKNGSLELGNGLSALTDGTFDLKDALADGAEEIRESSPSEATLDMFSEPLLAREEQVTVMNNNGHAMSAYMMSVGLWVGSLAFCLMYRLCDFDGELKNGISWWASKAVVIYPMAVIMAGILMISLKAGLGFSPVSMKLTFLAALVTSLAFMSIMYFFNVLLGKVGSFVMMIFMILQLTGSAGTYPLEISGPVTAALNKYMLFTYTVDAFRSTISGGTPIAGDMKILLLTAVGFSLLTILLFEYRSRRIRKGRRTLYDWISDLGFA